MAFWVWHGCGRLAWDCSLKLHSKATDEHMVLNRKSTEEIEHEDTQRLGISLVQHLPGVGQNFQNHFGKHDLVPPSGSSFEKSSATDRAWRWVGCRQIPVETHRRF